MVAYNFLERFVPPIRLGTKRHTIRADRKRHARPGEAAQLYVGQRTRHCRLIAAPTCESVWPVTIDIDGRVYADDGWITSEAELDAFAVSDGFEDWSDLRTFWQRQHPGVLIRWAPIVALAQTEADRGGQMDLFAPEARA